MVRLCFLLVLLGASLAGCHLLLPYQRAAGDGSVKDSQHADGPADLSSPFDHWLEGTAGEQPPNACYEKNGDIIPDGKCSTTIPLAKCQGRLLVPEISCCKEFAEAKGIQWSFDNSKCKMTIVAVQDAYTSNLYYDPVRTEYTKFCSNSSTCASTPMSALGNDEGALRIYCALGSGSWPNRQNNTYLDFALASRLSEKTKVDEAILKLNILGGKTPVNAMVMTNSWDEEKITYDTVLPAPAPGTGYSLGDFIEPINQDSFCSFDVKDIVDDCLRSLSSCYGFLLFRRVCDLDSHKLSVEIASTETKNSTFIKYRPTLEILFHFDPSLPR